MRTTDEARREKAMRDLEHAIVKWAAAAKAIEDANGEISDALSRLRRVNDVRKFVRAA